MTPEDHQELQELRQRNQKLASEKAMLGMIVEAYTQFANIEELDEILDFLLSLSLNLHGGSNVIVYYKSHEKWRFKDIYGKTGTIEISSDPLVMQATQRQTWFNKINSQTNHSPFKKGQQESPQAMCTTVFPLIYKRTVIAVVKLCERLVWNDEANYQLMTFFKYAATTLNLSIKNYELLEKMNQELSNQVRALNSKSAALKKSVEEKELLLAEVHHRVKNNLQIMSSLIQLQTKYINDKETKLHLHDIETRIRTMAIIHEHLYSSMDFSKIDLKPYITTLTHYLYAAYKMNPELVHMELDIASVQLGLTQSIPCGLIVNEIIANAFKYAFPKETRGTVKVCIKQIQDHCTIAIQDNGTGLPPNVSLHSGGRLGMQLINNLTTQLDGTIKLDTDAGTHYSISFPLIHTDEAG